MFWPRIALAGVGLLGAFGASAQEVSSYAQTPLAHERYSAVGLASWYGDEVGAGATANGERFNKLSLSAAHPTMPLPSYARVTNLSNGRSIVVRVNDRGPFVRGRIVDVSARVAKLLDFDRRGVAKVRVDYIGKAPPAGEDEPTLLASLQPHGPQIGEPAPMPVGQALEALEAAFEHIAEAPGTLAARALAPRSPYGELIAFPFQEQAALRLETAPPP